MFRHICVLVAGLSIAASIALGVAGYKAFYTALPLIVTFLALHFSIEQGIMAYVRVLTGTYKETEGTDDECNS